MSLYIHQENQKLIWDSIHKVPQFQSFEKTEPGNQELWFREIIQQFYESNKFKLLSIEELQQLNRDTISYMLQDLDNQMTKKETPSSYSGFSSSFNEMSPVNQEKQMIPFSSTMPMQNTEYTRDAILEKKQEQINQQFTTRQQEYGNMLKTTPNREIDFRANMKEDEPMENIDKLIQDKMKQREYDLNSPPHSSVKLDVIDLGNNTQNMQNTHLSLSNVSSDNHPSKNITKNPSKSVHWNETPILESVKHNPPQYSQTNDTNLSVLQDFMKDMRDTMNDMRNEIQSLKTKNDVLSKQSPNQNPLVNNILSRMKSKQGDTTMLSNTYEIKKHEL